MDNTGPVVSRPQLAVNCLPLTVYGNGPGRSLAEAEGSQVIVEGTLPMFDQLQVYKRVTRVSDLKEWT
jgi:hypothetical protein